MTENESDINHPMDLQRAIQAILAMLPPPGSALPSTMQAKTVEAISLVFDLYEWRVHFDRYGPRKAETGDIGLDSAQPRACVRKGKADDTRQANH